MAYSIVFAQEAEAARNEIIEYLLDVLRNRQAALHFVNALDEVLSIVVVNPENYVLSRDPYLARKGYRPCLFMNYVALYKIEDKKIKVAFIFHTSQDYAKLV